MKFSVGESVKIKVPQHDPLMPQWHRERIRVGKVGAVVNVTAPRIIRGVFITQYSIEFPDGEVLEYSESYLEKV